MSMPSPCERPLECGQCKKPIKIVYKELTANQITCTSMCAECPVYQCKLQGSSQEGKEVKGWAEKEKGVFCEKCGTSMEAIRMGQPLGCSDCYLIFDGLLTHELLVAEKVAPRMKPSLESKRSVPIHIGKSPHREADYNLSDKLASLNERLNDALKKEAYEEAAWLRDQIKALMENKDAGKNKNP